MRAVTESGPEEPQDPQVEPPESSPEEGWRDDTEIRVVEQPTAIESEPAVEEGPAPSLESLTTGIPESNRELLEELFRGRFVRVRKLDPRELR